jgi:hypothetical protein
VVILVNPLARGRVQERDMSSTGGPSTSGGPGAPSYGGQGPPTTGGSGPAPSHAAGKQDKDLNQIVGCALRCRITCRGTNAGFLHFACYVILRLTSYAPGPTWPRSTGASAVRKDKFACLAVGRLSLQRLQQSAISPPRKRLKSCRPSIVRQN